MLMPINLHKAAKRKEHKGKDRWLIIAAIATSLPD